MAIGYTENIFSKFKTQSVSVFAVMGDLYTKAQSLVKIPCGKSAQYSAQIAYKGAGSYSPAVLGFCLHSSHITGMWKGVLFFFSFSLYYFVFLFGKSKGDMVM